MVTLPGDLIVGDPDGVLAIRPGDLDSLSVLVRAIEDKERELLDGMANGTFNTDWVDDTLRQKGVAL